MNRAKYNPGFLSDEVIIDTFCVRTRELASIQETLAHLAPRSSLHSLVIGPRGSGKTHLLRRIAAEVRTSPSPVTLFPIVFAEESYEVNSTGEFWLECLDQLAEQAPTEYRAALRRTYQDVASTIEDGLLADRCLGALLDFSDRAGQRLLLIVENMNMLFAEMADGDAGWRLRKILQTEPRIVLLASATSRFEEIDNPDNALFDLFRVITLRPLDTAECMTLWNSMAQEAATVDIIRPLEILTGGNPRLLTIVARFGGGQSFGTLMGNLLDLVDDHTEYFKSHLESLPPQERRVYLALARLWKPSTAGEIAKVARLESNRCSAQLARLVRRGVVTKHGGSGRALQYYLSERLYNIYYLLRRGSGSDRLVRALVDFMICLYSPSGMGNVVQSVLREAQSVDVVGEELPEQMANAVLAEAKDLADSGREDDALTLYRDLIGGARSVEAIPIHSQIAAAMLGMGTLLQRLERHREAMQAFDELIYEYSSQDGDAVRRAVFGACFLKGLGQMVQQHHQQSAEALGKAVELVDQAGFGRIRPAVELLFALSLHLADRDEEARIAVDDLVALPMGEGNPHHARLLWTALLLKEQLLKELRIPLEEQEIELLITNLAELEELRAAGLRAIVRYAALSGPVRALATVGKADLDDKLLPLVVALRWEMGEKPRVAKEIEEVAHDVWEELRSHCL